MYDEKDLVEQVDKARQQQLSRITFIDDEGKEVGIVVKEINPAGICTQYD